MLAADSSPSTQTTPSPTSAAANSARLEGLLRAQVWRASSLGSGHSPCVGSGFAALNAELPGGGWPTQSLSEILTDGWAGVEWRLLAPALRSLLCSAPARPVKRGRTKQHNERPLLLINPPRTPHLPGLQRAGLPPERLIWIAPQTPAQQLWALEQAIKSNASAAILAWLPHAAPEQIRRLQSCAQAMDAPIFLFRPLSTQTQSSAAPLRLCVSSGPGWTLQVQIFKRRGPVHAGCLSLAAMPDDLAQVLTPQMLSRAQPQLQPPNTVEARHALARAAPQPAVL